MYFVKHYGSFTPPEDCGHHHRTCKGAVGCVHGYGGHEEMADVYCITSAGERLLVEGLRYLDSKGVVQAGPSVSAEDLSLLKAEGVQVIPLVVEEESVDIHR